MEKTSKSLRAALSRQARQPGNVLAPECPSRAVLSHVTSRWGVLVLVVLLGGMHRFSQLRKEVGGVSEKMLAQTLVALEGDGFVLRTALPEIPPHVEYSLTPLGREVAERLEVLVDWIEDNLPRILAPQEEAEASL
ncbi:winged helix-turn-helix transcriptional regulator [Pseudoduganella violaceinigra]|uniref:winged helix-turn-helix transcriptional regulator n=1 Tax=Pseudoduganella violaceinigra TaxID=246602 RepID=UPI000688E28D|nr:helix-turn-helix domain-containing protein [Pseudoduganella violaceinigra]